ncbi:MAG: shikimate kinase [Verrucomicrobia bacterium]|nr:shikimate kinase [Verrucomicrobiota bacterium]
MNEARHIRNLALAGFMGTGKSSVGRFVAAQLCFRFVDTDHLIEQRASKTISEIFDHDGEPAFRALEGEVVQELAQREKTVISTGGGLIVNPANLASLKEHALVVCLCAPAETIYERVRYASHRPLLRETEPLETIRRLLVQREPFYREADVLVSTDQRSVREVATHILHEFHSALRVPHDGQGSHPCPRP